ncbi:ImmA/IrrE family metallo-endopeptidase [Enterococcus faecium]|uniref:ImmA/IrrE family metallo-endopeptidase n=1 Tax=Enterococcus faecium TaxID=1352 RepID=UPI00065267B9|nr:ImmA/IrrE family metallo-endopeptidase [Enterococcus faecium]
MGEEFLVPTGFVIKEYLEYEGMTQKEFARRLGISEKHVSNLLNGKTRLTEEVALKIEKVLPPTLATYWLNHEAKYQEYMARKEEVSEYTDAQLKELSKRFHFNEVFRGLDWSLQKQANEMLKILRIGNFENFVPAYDSILRIDFMEDGGIPESIAVWLGIAREEIEIQNPKKLDPNLFNKDKLKKSLKRLKSIALTSNYNNSINSARKLFNRLGVYLVICEPITNSKVRGALTSYENTPVIYVSGRFKTHDNVWFALIHEVGHLLLHYSPEEILVTLEDEKNNLTKKENEANQFSREFFISTNDYKKFLDVNSGNITETAIREFAISQNVLPGIVVGRLQHDGILPYDMFDYLKDRI